MKSGLISLCDAMLVLPGHRVATGDVEIADGRIAAVREHAVVNPRRLVMPGFVNAHGHTPMTLVRGLGSGLPLDRWLHEAIFPVEARMRPADVKAGMIWGIMEMLAGGTTCVADMYDFPDACLEALHATGFRAHLARVGLSFVPGRLQECIAWTRAHPDVADFCIHSEYLTDEPFCRALAAANRDLRRPVNVHVSETQKEHAECLARHGKTPIAYLASTGLFDYGGYAAHGVWCTDDDFRIMAEKGITLVHNPTSNLKLGSGIARIVRARELGVNVALGTDGCASNDDLDMFEEMRLAALLPKGVLRDPTALSAWDVLDMATVNGARALGLSDVGTIAVGQRADLCVVALDRAHLQPLWGDVANLIVYAMHAADVEQTIVEGRVLYDRGAYPTIDVERASADFRAAVAGLHCAQKESIISHKGRGVE